MTIRGRRQPVPTNKTRTAPSLGVDDPRHRRQASKEAGAPELGVAGPITFDEGGRMLFKAAARASVPQPTITAPLQPLPQNFSINPPTREELGEAVNELVAYLEEQDISALRNSVAELIQRLQAAGLME